MELQIMFDVLFENIQFDFNEIYIFDIFQRNFPHFYLIIQEKCIMNNMFMVFKNSIKDIDISLMKVVLKKK